MERDQVSGLEMLLAGGKILTDIAARKSNDDVSAGDIVSKHLTESAKNLISKLRGRGRKRARETLGVKRGPKSRDNIKRTKRSPLRYVTVTISTAALYQSTQRQINLRSCRSRLPAWPSSTRSHTSFGRRAGYGGCLYRSLRRLFFPPLTHNTYRFRGTKPQATFRTPI